MRGRTDLVVLLAIELLLGGRLDRLDGEHSSVEARSVGLVAEGLLDGLLGAKQPAKEVLKNIDNVVEQRRHENLLRQVDNPHSNVGEEVLEAGVDNEGVDGLVEPGTALDHVQEGVEVLEHAQKSVGDSLAQLVERQVSDGLAGVLEELATGLQKANSKVDVTGEVKESNRLLGLGGKGARSERENRSEVGHHLGGIFAGNKNLPGLESGGGSSQSTGGDGGNGNGGELHWRRD
ncbi:uncharacterized protein YALI1_C07288g [Yarrowia lipolytica]|uniref:Uncharacterized protein n=1 Tax=Yarrowia lipolytica TaxID=4952 RepID=A0A1D8N9S3_YARLL|nr:hypothetical protein YALI1_C07288g [Yarrowia lipolytica]